MEFSIFFLISACIIGVFMAWGVGANDLANIMSTTMGSRAITVRQAMLIAVIFEFAGALLGGVHVTNTIRSGIIDVSLFVNHADVLVYGMIAVLLASMVWMLFASYIGMPVSITNTIVGALVGFGAIVLGMHAVHWNTVGFIALSWVCTPIAAGIGSYWLFVLVRRFILATGDPLQSARRHLPWYFFMVGIVLSIMTVLKDVVRFGYHPNGWYKFLIVLATSVVILFLGMFLCRQIPLPHNAKRYQRYEYIEKQFGILMAFTACAMVFAHGSNDVAIAVGPVAAIYSMVMHNGSLLMQDPVPLWIMIMGCVGVVLGLFMYGHKVIATVGKNITSLTPSRAFAATFAAAVAVIVSTSSGIPVSATQTLVGGVFGVGLARGIGALNLNVMRNIFLSWFVTVPAAAMLAIVFFDIMQWIFHFI
ncbi:MAG: inorganic phosphate transporter [Gammaproteobacteria bacterium]